MFAMKCFLFLCLSLAVLEADAGVASFIKPCHYTDIECLLESSKKAMPEIVQGIADFGIPSFDPLVLDKEINGDNGDLKLKFKKMIVKNIPKCEITKIERPEKLRIEVELVCPITATGQYVLGGKLFVLEVKGDGDFEIKTNKIKISVSVALKVIEKDGKKYYKFNSFDYTYDALEKVYFTFHNLYDGDKAKAEPVISILDQSWKELFNEIGKPVLKEIITQVVHAFGKLFTHVPCNEIEVE